MSQKELEESRFYMSFSAILATSFIRQKKPFEKRLACCSQTVGILYKFDNKSLVSFESNYRFLGDLSFVAYFAFETSAGSDFLYG